MQDLFLHTGGMSELGDDHLEGTILSELTPDPAAFRDAMEYRFQQVKKMLSWYEDHPDEASQLTLLSPRADTTERALTRPPGAPLNPHPPPATPHSNINKCKGQ